MEQQSINVGAGNSTENYRARVTRLESGETLITPIKDGTRGPLYSEPLTTTTHGRLTRTTRNWHISFDIPVSENIQFVGDCLEEEVNAIVNFIREQQ